MRAVTLEQPNFRRGLFRHCLCVVLSASAMLAIAACGGGGGGSASNPPPSQGTDPPPDTDPPPNTSPEANAGADQEITLPTNSVELAGSATDAETPATSLTYAWSVTTGSDVTFSNASSASTTATFAEPGTYVLTLTVSDGSLEDTDEVQIVVNPVVYPAADDNSADGGWLRVPAADAGMDQTLLDQASTFAMTGGTATTFGGAGMIVRHGRLVHSWGDIHRRFDVKSTTKSIGGIALGLAVDQGLVALADTAQTYLPDIGTPPAENVGTGWLDDITVLQLATHTAGFEKPGGYVKLVNQPGTTWSYSDGGLNWLADMLTGPMIFNQDLDDVLAPVWSTLGVELAVEDGTLTCGDAALGGDVCWRANVQRPGPHPSGIEHRELASGIWINANAMARIGLLFLRNGLWSEDQRVISEAFVHTVHTPPAEVAGALNPNADTFPNATSNYGVLWWTNATGSAGLLANVPADAYWAWGLGDSLIIVIPSLDLVIVRAGVQTTTPSDGRIWNDNDWDGNYAVLAPFIDPIVAAVTQQ